VTATELAEPQVITPESHRTGRFPAFDGFRAIAALAVLVTHVTFSSDANRMFFGEYFARMDAGVAVFFLISGFLLYRPFVVARFAGEPGPAIVPYLWRRTLRIYPALWVATLVAVYIFGFSPFTSTKDAFLHLGLVHIYDPGTVLQGPILQSWTLGTELSFYLFLPIYAAVVGWIALHVRNRLRLELLGVAALYGVSLAWQLIVLASPGRLDGMYMTWLPAWLDLFALGMGLAVVSAWLTQTARPAPFALGRRWAPPVCWALAVVAFWAVSTQVGLPRSSIEYSRSEEMLRHLLYGATAFFLLLPGVFGPQDQGGIRRFLRWRVLAWLGLVSYGIYLWHEIWITQFFEWTGDQFQQANFGQMLAVVLGLTIVTAAISWYVVERPMLRLKGWAPIARVHAGRWWSGLMARLAVAVGPAGNRSRFARWLLVIALAAFAVRVVSVLTIATDDPGFGDGLYYHQQANMLADGKGFAEPFTFLDSGRVIPSATHPPLYTVVLAIPSLVGVDSFLAHKITSCLIGVALVVAIGILARRIGGDRVGLLAAGIAAVYPNLWAIDGILLPEGLFSLVIVLVVLTSYRFLDQPTWQRAAVVGALIGAAMLVRGEAVFLFAVLALPMVLRLRDRPFTIRLRWLVIAGVAAGLVLVPWVARTATSFEEPVLLSTNDGDVLSQANCDITYYGDQIGFWSFVCGEQIEVSGDESQRSKERRSQALEYISDNASRVPVVVAARVGRLWEVFRPLQNTKLSLVEGRDLNVSRAGLAMYWVLVPLAIVGILVLRRRRTPPLLPLLAPVVMVTITAMTAYGEIRFRAAAEATIVIGAAVLVDAAFRARSARREAETSDA
jgi:peptidoglycan/LPS O-acetylase OafA/YrhL/4-amino-4-deoxy-L-arabinose transferase-like glycosyltransferase